MSTTQPDMFAVSAEEARLRAEVDRQGGVIVELVRENLALKAATSLATPEPEGPET